MRRGKTIEQRAREAVAEWRRIVKSLDLAFHADRDEALRACVVRAIDKAITADRRKRGERG